MTNPQTQLADKQQKSLKSLIIPIDNNPKDQTNQLSQKINIIAFHLNVTNLTQKTVITTIYQLFKNTPFKNTQHAQNQILTNIISINHTCKTIKTNSAINMAINRLYKSGVLIRMEGYYSLNSAFKDLEGIDQIVFRVQ